MAAVEQFAGPSQNLISQGTQACDPKKALQGRVETCSWQDPRLTAFLIDNQLALYPDTSKARCFFVQQVVFAVTGQIIDLCTSCCHSDNLLEDFEMVYGEIGADGLFILDHVPIQDQDPRFDATQIHQQLLSTAFISAQADVRNHSNFDFSFFQNSSDFALCKSKPAKKIPRQHCGQAYTILGLRND